RVWPSSIASAPCWPAPARAAPAWCSGTCCAPPRRPSLPTRRSSDLAPEPLTLIIARALQGAAGAMLVPSSLALIMATMRGELQSRAIGVWTAFTTGAQIAGPLLGGIFVDLLSWRLVFLINVIPIGITLVLLARLQLPDHPPGA